METLPGKSPRKNPAWLSSTREKTVRRRQGCALGPAAAPGLTSAQMAYLQPELGGVPVVLFPNSE